MLPFIENITRKQVKEFYVTICSSLWHHLLCHSLHRSEIYQPVKIKKHDPKSDFCFIYKNFPFIQA